MAANLNLALGSNVDASKEAAMLPGLWPGGVDDVTSRVGAVANVPSPGGSESLFSPEQL